MAKLSAEQKAKNRERAQVKRKVTVEEKRLRKTYEKLPKDQIAIADGLIRRAAFMRVTLEVYELDLFENGYVELFSQSDKTDPYERERPVARLYNTLNKNYQSIIKQLSDMLPKGDEVGMPIPENDGFDDFINRR